MIALPDMMSDRIPVESKSAKLSLNFKTLQTYKVLSDTFELMNCLTRHGTVNTHTCLILIIMSFGLVLFCVLVFVPFLGHFVMVPFNLTYLLCLQHYFFEHLFNLLNCKYLEYSFICMGSVIIVLVSEGNCVQASLQLT